MNWKKLGKIFDPTQFVLPNNCTEFAQSPQVLIFDNFIRIYFSARERDKPGKYLSRVFFVDMDKDFQQILRVSPNQVIELGGLGCYDEHGIFPFNVIRENGSIRAYLSGWSRRVSVSVETSIGVAISSDDGLSYKRVGDGPVLTSSLYEPLLVVDPFVLKVDSMFNMWYAYGTKWVKHPEEEFPQRVYKIGHAASQDGFSWIKTGKQLIEDILNPDECQALPTVVKHKGRYHMYFCYREVAGFRTERSKAYRIGYAWSDDLQNWTRDEKNVGIELSEEGWDSQMMCYPHVFHCNDKLYMLYNGNEFGRFGFGLAVCED